MRKHPDLDAIFAQFTGHVADTGGPDRGVHDQYESAFIVGVGGHQMCGLFGGKAFTDRVREVLQPLGLGGQFSEAPGVQ